MNHIATPRRWSGLVHGMGPRRLRRLAREHNELVDSYVKLTRLLDETRERLVLELGSRAECSCRPTDPHEERCVLCRCQEAIALATPLARPRRDVRLRFLWSTSTLS